MMGSGDVVLPLYGPKKVKENKLIVDPPMGLKPNKLRVEPKNTRKINKFAPKSDFPAPMAYTPIKNTMQVNKVYKSY